MNPPSLRVLLVARDDSYAGFLRTAFADQPAFELSHLTSAALAEQHLHAHGCDVVLLEFAAGAARAAAHALLEVLGGMDAAPPAVALLDAWSEASALEAMRAGAREYLLEADADPRTVLRSIRYAIERDRVERALRERDMQLRQSQKLEAIGRLAGGIAHDFGNLLTVIVGATDRLLERLPADSPSWQDADAVRATAARAVKLTQQILAFSRQQAANPTLLDVNELLASMEPFVRPLVGEDLDLKLTFAPEVGMVRADRSQLEQVFLNLIVNARDATPAGGRLLIETRTATIRSASELPGLEPGRYVVAAVIDSGHGMDAATQEHAFDPFFTTKEGGQGTGLGLSIAHGIVARSGGTIRILSEAGAGTSMLVYLPAAERAQAPAPEQTAAPATRAGGNETILLVEDEDAVRELVHEMLEAAGFRVMSAGRPLQAEELCRDFDGVIHLLLTDVVMPDMSGRELAQHVKAMRPDTKVLFMSGYPEHSALRSGGGVSTDMPLLPKPFNRKALLERVRSVLDAAPV